ncbi:MAG: hypothetical protein KAH24_09945, partial [Holophagae bacterium]|nr:hypothetical protein [Holophagae bacterium]
MKQFCAFGRLGNTFIYVFVVFLFSVSAVSGVRSSRVIRIVGSQPLSTKVNSTDKHLYFPLLKNGSDYISYIGLVNVDDHTVTFALHVMDQNGEEAVGTIEGSLEPMGRYYASVSANQLEGNLWGEVVSDGHLAGYLNLIGRDGTRSMFIQAGNSLEKQLYLPHIAEKTQYWDTFTAIVNGNRMDNETSNVFLDY